MTNLLRKPKNQSNDNLNSRYEKFNLKENPFPSEPVVNRDSMDKRINGDIYESQIRSKEYDLFIESFVKYPQSDPSHIRLGYILDTSYIGRGNGKSAFLINLLNDINSQYCLDLSEEVNKCFGIYVTPDTGGRTKTFPKLLDLIFKSILNSNIINTSLATLRLEALAEIDADNQIFADSEKNIIAKLNDINWFSENNIDLFEIQSHIKKNELIHSLPPDFPMFNYDGRLMMSLINQKHFESYYLSHLKKADQKIEFVFSHLVKLFRAAGFNGAYIFVDDFERVPDFQSARQKKDFALELRSILYDGTYHNAKIGFFNLILVLHAGVPRLLSDAWGQSGMEHRAPMSTITPSKHIIPFEKLNKEHAILMISKYLREYRIADSKNPNDISPFEEEAVGQIGELSEYNAARILKLSYDLLDKAAVSDNVTTIDSKFISQIRDHEDSLSNEKNTSIQNIESTNLLNKALKNEDE